MGLVIFASDGSPDGSLCCWSSEDHIAHGFSPPYLVLTAQVRVTRKAPQGTPGDMLSLPPELHGVLDFHLALSIPPHPIRLGAQFILALLPGYVSPLDRCPAACAGATVTIGVIIFSLCTNRSCSQPYMAEEGVKNHTS